MKERRESYQSGTVRRVKRKRGPDVWVFRYRRYFEDGHVERAAKQLGDVIELPTKAKAKEKAAEFARTINEQRVCVFFRDLAKKYDDEVISTKRPHLQTTYRANLRHCKDKWGDVRLEDMARAPMNIETWLNALKSQKDPEKDLAKQTRTHVRNLLHHVFESADHWGLLTARRNPVSTVHVKQGVRPKARDLLVSADLFRALLEDPRLEYHVKVMVQVAMFTGMRASEFLGLKWEDVDFQRLEIKVKRSVVGNHIDQTKTPDSAAVVYISDYLADVLADWKKHPEYPVIEGWVFGSARTERPFHEMTLQTKHLKPAGRRAGVDGLGWHSFRHTYRAGLRDVAKAPIEIQQAMLRHSSIEMTGKYGAQSEEKKQQMRDANLAWVRKVAGL